MDLAQVGARPLAVKIHGCREESGVLAAMGNGASAAAGVAAAAGKMDEKELSAVVAALDKETADKLRKALGGGP